MKNEAQIKIKATKEHEVDLFIKFLAHPYYPQHKQLILKSFLELQSLSEPESSRLAIEGFIDNFYKQHEKKIEIILLQSNDIIEQKGTIAIKALDTLMDYHRDKPVTYLAIPTILPFSPFEKNKIYFSILGQIFDKGNKNILFVAIHEISHFIFYDVLEKIEFKNNRKITVDAKNYLKESLTAVLLNQRPLCDILNLQNYLGNPELGELTIQKLDGGIQKINDFLKDRYEIKNKENKTFDIFLEEIIQSMESSQEEFSKKRTLWNKYGNQLHKNPEALSEYQKPIKVTV